MKRAYRFAGITILIDIPEEKMYQNEYRLQPFSLDGITGTDEFIYQYKFKLVEKLSKPIGKCVADEPNYRVYRNGEQSMRYVGTANELEDESYICVTTLGNKSEVELLSEKFPKHVGTKTVLNALDVHHLMAENKGFILHCSYIERDGKAILFTAPSETGKSTQAKLWKKLRNADIINGDRAAIRIADGQLVAEGIPFAGSSTYCKNKSMPIEAIVYLEQALQTRISRLRGYKTFFKIWEGVGVNAWNKHDVELVADVVKELIEKVPIYHLACTPDETAVIALENELRKEW